MRKVFPTITDNYFIKDIKAEDGSVLARYTHSGLRTDDVLAVDISSSGVSRGLASQSGSYFYLKDGLGSIQAITTESGNLVQRYIYSSFGKLLKVVDAAGLETTSFKTPFTYTNRELDEESGLYYFRARYYDAHSGRFLQEDPHPGKFRNPVSFNSKYTYANNNPILFKDPDGRLPFLAVAIIVGAVIGGIDAGMHGGNILQGIGYGAVSGLAIGAGIMAAGALVGGGAGVGSLLVEMGVSGFLSGLFNASALGLVKGSVNDFNKDFKSGFIGGALGTAFKGPGVPEGTEQGLTVEEIAEDDLGEDMTMESVRKAKQKMKFQMGI